MSSPFMNDLLDDKLLSRCLDGKTQNQNECFNNHVWMRIPKTLFVGMDIFRFGVYDAVAVFNIRKRATLEIIRDLKMKPGHYTVKGCVDINKARLYHIGYKSKDKAKKSTQNH